MLVLDRDRKRKEFQEKLHRRRKERRRHAREILLRGGGPLEVERAMHILVEVELEEEIELLRQRLADMRARHRQRLRELRREKGLLRGQESGLRLQALRAIKDMDRLAREEPGALLAWLPQRHRRGMGPLSYGEAAILLERKYRVPRPGGRPWTGPAVRSLVKSAGLRVDMGHDRDPRAAARVGRGLKADEFALMFREKYLPRLDTSQTHYQMARKLNEMGAPTPSGRGKWVNVSVRRVLERIKRLEEEEKMREEQRLEGQRQVDWSAWGEEGTRLLEWLTRGRKGLLRSWLDALEGIPRIAWYPSAGEDFRDLLYLSPAYARFNPGVIPEPQAPDLFLHTDYFPWSTSDFLDSMTLYQDRRTTVRVLEMEELPRCVLPLDNRLVFLNPSVATHRVVFMLVEVRSTVLGRFTAPVLYVFSENSAFCARRLLPSRTRISHIVHVRYGGGCGGGGMSSGQWLLDVLEPLGCEVLVSDDHYGKEGTDKFPVEVYPELRGKGRRPQLLPFRTIPGESWSDHGDVSWYQVRLQDRAGVAVPANGA